MTDTPTLTATDSLGRAFDPTRFRMKGGIPQLDSLGRFVPLRTGRPRKTPGNRPAAPAKTLPAIIQTPAPMSEPAPSTPPAPDVTSPASASPGTSQPPPSDPMHFGGRINFDDIARAASAPASDEPTVTGEAVVIDSATTETVISIIQTAFVLIGDDEGVLSKAEKEMLRRPLKRVLDKYDIGDKILPAEADLAFVMATLLITRLQKPKTATWFARAKAWFVRTFFRAKGEMLAREMRRKVGDMPPRHVATPEEAAAAEEGAAS